MIIKGRSRAGADELATHLMRVDTNERMEVIEIRGTVASDLRGALREMCAVAAGTRCKSNLYHGSINVRVEERLELEQWIFAIDALEKRLSLSGQPRAIVMHEKHGREHVHIVWSRIDCLRMCAISDSHNYRAHEEVSRELERIFGHEYTQGAHVEREGVARPARTHSHAEQQQRARTGGADLATIVLEVTDLWRATDDGLAFQAALKEKGYVLARGDRRDFVIVDRQGGIHSLARRIEGIRVAELRARLRDLDHASLPSTKEACSHQEARLAERRVLVPATNVQTPSALFQNLLRTRSYVTESELARAFDSEAEAEAAICVIRNLPDTRPLYEVDTGQLAGYTTPAIVAQELAVLSAARRLASRDRSTFDPRILTAACVEHGLSEEQTIATRAILSGKQLSILVGRAGTGKSATLNAVRVAAEREGFEEILALGPTNAVVADLQDNGFSRASTIHSLFWHLDYAPDHPKAKLKSKTLIVVDEAGMLDTARLERLLTLTEQSAGDVRLVLVGDDRQLASVDRGGMFSNLVDEIDVAKLSTVRRQERHWARRASEAFSEGRFRDGLEALADRDLIAWSATLDESRASLVNRYKHDTIIDRGRRFIFAYTNEEVRRLNDAIQAVEVERGRVRNVESFETERGTIRIGEGDRIVYRSTDKARGIVNGLFATVKSIEGSKLVALTDRGRSITFDLENDATVDLGYAGTIYRGQGKTLDEVYLLHTRHWRDAASYVAFTRARGSTRVFVSKDQARNLGDLAMQMSRQSYRGTTLGFAQKSLGLVLKTPCKEKVKIRHRVKDYENES